MVADIVGITVNKGSLLRAAGYTGGGGYDVFDTLEIEGLIETSVSGEVRLTEDGRRFVRRLFKWEWLFLSKMHSVFVIESFILIAIVILLLLPFWLGGPLSKEEYMYLCRWLFPLAVEVVLYAALILDIIGIILAYAKYKEVRDLKRRLGYH